MTLSRPPMTNVNMTARANCTVSACSPLPLSIKALVHCSLDRSPPPGCQPPKYSKVSFPPTWPLYWLLSSEQPDPTFSYITASESVLLSATLPDLKGPHWPRRSSFQELSRKNQHWCCFIFHDPWWSHLWRSHYGQVTWSTSQVLSQWNPTAVL